MIMVCKLKCCCFLLSFLEAQSLSCGWRCLGLSIPIETVFCYVQWDFSVDYILSSSKVNRNPGLIVTGVWLEIEFQRFKMKEGLAFLCFLKCGHTCVFYFLLSNSVASVS